MSSIDEYLEQRLFELQDLKYRDFHCKLMPTVDKEMVIGVRTPELLQKALDFKGFRCFLCENERLKMETKCMNLWIQLE